MTTVLENMAVSAANECITCLYSCNFSMYKQHRKVSQCYHTAGRKRAAMFLHLMVFGIVLRLLSSGAAQEEDDHLRPAQEELMTPESTSSVFPRWTHAAGAQSRLLPSCCSCITGEICLQQPAALHTSHCTEGWGNSYCVMYTCKIW